MKPQTRLDPPTHAHKPVSGLGWHPSEGRTSLEVLVRHPQSDRWHAIYLTLQSTFDNDKIGYTISGAVWFEGEGKERRQGSFSAALKAINSSTGGDHRGCWVYNEQIEAFQQLRAVCGSKVRIVSPRTMPSPASAAACHRSNLPGTYLWYCVVPKDLR